MKSFRHILFCIITVLVCSSCKDNKGTAETDHYHNSTWYSYQRADSLYNVHEAQPALHIVDSLIDDDNYKVSGLTEDENLRILTHIWRLRTKIMSFLNDIPQMEESARKTAEVCCSIQDKDDGIRCVISEMDVYLGTALSNTGRKQEGYKLMDEAIHQLDGMKSWESRQAQISFMHKIAAQYSRVEDAHKLDSVCNLALAKLDALPGEYKTLEYFTNEADANDFVMFFTGKFLAWQAHAYLNLGRLSKTEAQKEAYRDSARICVEKAQKTEWGNMPDASVMLFAVYPYIGMYDDFEKASAVLTSELGEDTLNNMYVDVLRCKSYVAEKQGNMHEALDLQKQADAVAAKTYYNNIQSQMSKTVEAHLLDNEHQAHLETRMHLLQLCFFSAVLVLVIVVLIIHYVHRQRKQRELSEQYLAIIDKYKSDSHDDETVVEEPTNKENMKEQSRIETEEAQTLIYARVMAVMKEQKPYLDSAFDVNTLAGLVFSNRTYVSRAINKICGKNFYGWLADYRNEIVIHALQQDPDLSALDLCSLTGYSGKETLSRQFKQLNGMTLTEFKKQLG